MSSTPQEVLASPELRRLVRKRWTISLALCALLFTGYYGYVVAVAVAPEMLARRIDGVTTLGIPLGVGVIVLAWALTAAYVLWANRVYDPEVAALRKRLDV
jgi:uncharacterized membrane protein (DUF485 family)